MDGLEQIAKLNNNWQDISPYFTMEEIFSPEAIKYPHRICSFALYLLNQLREELDLPLIINTWGNGGHIYNAGVRTVDDNIDLRGAKHSMHVCGRAFDIKCVGYTGRELFEMFEKLHVFKMWNGVGIYANFVHIDTRTDLDDKITVWHG